MVSIYLEAIWFRSEKRVVTMVPISQADRTIEYVKGYRAALFDLGYETTILRDVAKRWEGEAKR